MANRIRKQILIFLLWASIEMYLQTRAQVAVI